VISAIAPRSVLLHRGQLVLDDDTPAVLRKYRSSFELVTQGLYVNESAKMGLLRARVLTSTGSEIHNFGKPLTFEFEFQFSATLRNGAFSFQIVDEDAKPIAHLWLFDNELKWTRQGRVSIRCVIPAPKLYMGQYTLATYLTDRAGNEQFETLEQICPFEVVMDGIYREYAWVKGTCAYIEEQKWEIFKPDF
jgi:lipopolysaccharide transport system ATP-binding protein